MFDVKGKKVLVLGLGLSGFAAAELLGREGALVKVSESSDSDVIRKRLEALAEYSVQYETGGHTAGFCGDAGFVVASPGIDIAPLYSSGILRKEVPAIGELELGAMFCRAPIIAITGTNGKSTVTELIGRMLSSSGRHAVVCGNIGNPLSGEVHRLTGESVAVVEVSSFQLETVRNFKPHIAVLLNVSEDHYDRHRCYDNYMAVKFKIFRNQAADDWAVLHSSLRGGPLTDEINGRLRFFGAGGTDAAVEEGGVTAMDPKSGEKVVINADEIQLRGAHNLENVACSILVCGIMGVDTGCIREAVKSFDGLDHRFQKIADHEGVEFMDDSKATNIDATRRALESMNKKVVLIAGGRDKGGDYRSILPLVKQKVKAMVLIGEARERIKDAFSSAVPVFEAEDMASAVTRAFAEAERGEAVLLSPMCSSFDMFSSYKERGEVFRGEVRRLAVRSSRFDKLTTP